MMSNFMIFASTDNVGTAISDLKSEDVLSIDEKQIKLRDEIKFGHKFSIKHINKGDFILKYGGNGEVRRQKSNGTGNKCIR